MISKFKFLLVGILITASLSSCYTTKVAVGDVSPQQPMTKINSEWNHHILWGLVSLENASMRADDYVGERKRYIVKTSQSFLNGLVSCLTLGVYTPTSTSYYVPFDEYDYNDSRCQGKTQRSNNYERVRENEVQRAEPESRTTVRSVSKPEYQPEQEVSQYPVETTVNQKSEASVPAKVAQNPADAYRATIYFKDGARMDGIVTEQSTNSKIQIKLPSGLLIESAPNEIERIVRK